VQVSSANKERRGFSHLKEEALDRTVWGNRFGGGFGPVVRQTTEWKNILVHTSLEDESDQILNIFLH